MGIEESRLSLIRSIEEYKNRMNKFKVHKDSIKRKHTKSTIDLKKGKRQSKRNYFYFKRYLKKDRLRNKTFSANVVIINERERTYGVYAEYGQDLIPFDKAKKI